MNTRILKFRIWDIHRRKWITDTYEVFHFVLNDTFTDTGIIIQQFTGLTDKNSKEIYEGDILSSDVNEKPCNYIVKWGSEQSEYCGFVLNPVMKNPPRITFHIHNFQMWMANGFSVIGNIFENSELLNEKKN